MPYWDQVAVGEPDLFRADTRTHLMAINPAATEQVDESGVSHPYLTVSTSCKGCHNDQGIAQPLPDERLMEVANNYHDPELAGTANPERGSRFGNDDATAEPTAEPTEDAADDAASEPIVDAPTPEEPTVEATAEPTSTPTVEPTLEATVEATAEPTPDEPDADATEEPAGDDGSTDSDTTGSDTTGSDTAGDDTTNDEQSDTGN